MAIRHVRDEEIIAAAVRGVQRVGREASRPTGTERARTMETAEVAGADAEFSKQLAEQLQTELGEAQVEITQALTDSAAALEAAGLAGSEAAVAVAAAQAAAADASQAITDALEAADLARGSTTWLDRAPVVADAAGKPDGAAWYQLDATGVIAMWELKPLGWVSRPFMEVMIPQIQIGSGTYGALAGDRIVARSILADRIAALSITAWELAADSVTAVKIAANAVVAAKIDAGAVTTEKLFALAVTAEKIAVGAIVAEKIAVGAITAGKIAATAIDGMTITGALIRTAATGQRMQLDVNGLRCFNAAGTETARLVSDSGGIQLATGTLLIGSASANYSSLSSGSLSTKAGTYLAQRHAIGSTFSDGVNGPDYLLAGYQANGFSVNKSGAVDRVDSTVSASVHDSSFTVWKRKGVTADAAVARILAGSLSVLGSTGSGLYGYLDADAARVDAVRGRNGLLIHGDGGDVTITAAATAAGDIQTRIHMNGKEIRLNAADVTFQGDTDWANLVLLSGWVAQNGLTPRWRIRRGVLQFNGRFGRSNGTVVGESFVTVTAANAAIAAAAAAAGAVEAFASTPGAAVNLTGLLRIMSNGSIQVASAEVAFFPNVEFLT